jgi:Bacterial Ig-like domain (group 3)
MAGVFDFAPGDCKLPAHLCARPPDLSPAVKLPLPLLKRLSPMGLPFVNRSRTARRRRASVASKGRLEALEARQLLSTFTVTSTLDDGSTGTLRWAIGQVNADTADSAASPDRVAFNIPGTGPFTISPTTALPTVTRPVVIDGYSEPGAHPNTLPKGDDAVILIQLDGTQAGTTADGLTLAGGSSTVGGLSITHFKNNGIHLEAAGTDLVTGNFIGLDPAGTTAEGNTNDGVFIDGVASVTIGGISPAARDVISSNGLSPGGIFTGAGVFFSNSAKDLIQGNFFGTERTGLTVLAGSNNPLAGDTGIDLDFHSSTNATIGGPTPGAGNVISGSNDQGILLGDNVSGSVSPDALIQGNLIGTDVTGTKALGNGGGIELGSNSAVLGNVISDSAAVAVDIEGDSNRFQGNLIGTDITGKKALGNGGEGGFEAVMVFGGFNTIGGVNSGNVISGGTGTGIFLAEGLGGMNVIQGNLIGTDITGMVSLGNGGYGIESFAQGFAEGIDVIGGITPGAGNLISGNKNAGIFISTETGVETKIQGNIIGLNAEANSGLGNGGDGILSASTGSTIGGDTPGAGNIVSGNAGFGIAVEGSGNLIQGNDIGTGADGLGALGNAKDGVVVEGVGNTIGGTFAGANTIAFNHGTGVLVPPAPQGQSSGVDNAILFNSIHDNSALGIDLNADGVTPNTPGGPHSGPNDLQNYPVLTTASSSASTTTTIVGTLNSTPNATFTVQFFSNPAADPSGHGQGQTYLGELNDVHTDASGNASFSFVAPVAVPGQFISATATDPSGNTSEFSQDIQAVPLTPTSTAITSVQPSAPTFGQPVTFTATVTPGILQDGPSGTITFSIDGVPQAPSPVVPTDGGFAGLATFTASGLAAGSHTITASYSGDASFAPSVSRAFSVTVGQAATTTTLAVAPSTANAGQPVTLSATVAGPGTPGGAVTFFDGSTMIGTVALGQGGTAVLVLTSLAPGSHSLSAAYAGDPNHLASTSAAVVEVITPAVPMGDGPRVVEVDRFGFHAMPTALVLLFDQPMDAAGAENPANYVIIGPRGQTIRVKSAVLDPGSMAVTLSLRERLNVHLRYTLIVEGASPGGLRGTSGLLLDGAGNGVPGSDYVAPITFRNLRGPSNGHPFAVARQVSHPAPHASGHLAQRHASKPRGHAR